MACTKQSSICRQPQSPTEWYLQAASVAHRAVSQSPGPQSKVNMLLQDKLACTCRQSPSAWSKPKECSTIIIRECLDHIPEHDCHRVLFAFRHLELCDFLQRIYINFCIPTNFHLYLAPSEQRQHQRGHYRDESLTHGCNLRKQSMWVLCMSVQVL